MGYRSITWPLFSKCVYAAVWSNKIFPTYFIYHLCSAGWDTLASPLVHPHSPTTTAKSCRHHNSHCCFTEKQREKRMPMDNNTSLEITSSYRYPPFLALYPTLFSSPTSPSRDFRVYASPSSSRDFLQWPEESLDIFTWLISLWINYSTWPASIILRLGSIVPQDVFQHNTFRGLSEEQHFFWTG